MIQLLTLLHEFAETEDTGGQMDLVFLDFFEALDRVPALETRREARSLWNMGSGTWILGGLIQQVIVDGATSLLFLLFINDQPE